MDSEAAVNSSEYINYQKWTGQQSFEEEDEGLYEVVFYWALSDGRYLSDSKYVVISPLEPEIEKTVDKAYDDAGEDNTITYSITYTNANAENPVTFAILDILPYSGDVRLNEEESGGDLSSTVDSGLSYTLKSLTVSQNGAATIKGIYYSQDKENIRQYLYDGSSASISAAEKLNVDEEGKIDNSNSYWTDITRNDIDVTGTYTPADATDVTAIAVSGVQLGVSESITVEIVLEYDGSIEDVYVNNAFFFAREADSTEGVSGSSDPVTTVIIGRNLSGYVWLDNNEDGFLDANEARIGNVKAALYKNVSGSNPVLIEEMITDDTGYYNFENLESGEYFVVFLENAGNPVIYDGTAGGRTNRKFSELGLTEVLIEANVTNAVGSRNIAQIYETDGTGIPSNYYIANTLPTTEAIYRKNYANTVNVIQEGYLYSKLYQNMGLTDCNGSITIIKQDEKDNPLNGVTFKLEYFDEATSTWLPVCYDANGYADKEITTGGSGISEFTTGQIMADGSKEDGKVIFPNLYAGKYRITEISTIEGYNLLASSIEVEIPYKISVEEAEENKILEVNNVSQPDYTKDGYHYYRDITFTISNTTVLNTTLPLTGVESNNIMLYVGLAFIMSGITLFLIALAMIKIYDVRIRY